MKLVEESTSDLFVSVSVVVRATRMSEAVLGSVSVMDAPGAGAVSVVVFVVLEYELIGCRRNGYGT